MITPDKSYTIMVGHRWWQQVLEYRLAVNWEVSLLRYTVFFLGVICIVFAFRDWRAAGVDRAMLYGLTGVIACLQEAENIDLGSPMLIWREPLFLALTVLCIVSMRKYLQGKHR